MRKLLGMGCIFSLFLTSHAELKLNSLFSDHIVLQQKTGAKVWGSDSPGTTITVSGSWGAVSVATANADGKWMATLKTPRWGGPYQVNITGTSTITLNDVQIGEVWVCSGQSNMEWPLSATDDPSAVYNANDSLIRQYFVPHNFANAPVSDAHSSWTVCSPQTAAGYTAVGYHFAQTLRKVLGIQIGIINTSVGGTEVELWTSQPFMRKIPKFAQMLDASDGLRKNFESRLRSWRRQTMLVDAGYASYMDTDYDDTTWNATQTPNFEKMGLEKYDGSVWYRATVTLDGVADAKLILGTIDDWDETYVNGTLVGTNSEWSVLRDYAVPANLLKQGKNVITMRCMDWMGLGGMVAPEGGFRLEMGDQKIAISDWKWKKGADKKDLPIAPESGEPNISKLHQGMIAPLLPYTVKGALWYQGEANVGRATEYEQLFSTMIDNWRSDFQNPKMSFYFVQIAPFTYGTPNQASARLRQAQLDTYHHVPNTGMVVVTDITGNLRDIHPRDKLHVGQRLAAWALAKNYGQKVMFSGPIYKSFRVIGKEIEISFDFATKLHAIGGQIRGFSVAGTDKKFLPAMARVVGNKVMVISPVDKPAAVRFGWEDAPELGVFDESGLPMSPFRSDNWEDAVMMVGQ